MNTLLIIGRKWRDSNGNTYHTAEIFIDGQFQHKTPMSYGYGEQYLQTAKEWLTEQELITPEEYSHGGSEPLWQYCDRKDIHLERREFAGKKGDL